MSGRQKGAGMPKITAMRLELMRREELTERMR